MENKCLFRQPNDIFENVSCLLTKLNFGENIVQIFPDSVHILDAQVAHQEGKLYSSLLTVLILCL